MIVPDFWAEARRQHRGKGRQVTVRRFGWSMASQSDAQEMAESRAAEALARILSGEKLPKREPKIAYNGAHGVPIREEVLGRRGDDAITRNAYGAHCLNTPHALFADIDFETNMSFNLVFGVFVVLLGLGAVVAWTFRNWALLGGAAFIAVAFTQWLAEGLAKVRVTLQGGHAQQARRRIAAFLRGHPDWSLRIYKTPNGLRLLATHRMFLATMPEVQEFFRSVGVDPLYERMCMNQHCFRARLTAKPWRIGIPSHMRPRPGVWPIRPERQSQRDMWVARYEAVAAGFAACHFIETQGSGVVDPSLEATISLHDQESQALRTDLPIA